MKNKTNKSKGKTVLLIIFSIILCFLQSIVNSPSSFFTGICFVLPLIIAIGVNDSETTGLWFGLITGIVIDSLSCGTIAFNAILLMIFGYFSSVLIKYYFNKSVRSCIVITLTASIVYYGLYLLIYRLNGNGAIVNYLLNYALKGIVFSIIFCIPLYYLVLLIENKFTKEGNKWQRKKEILE